jgi:hypothetical protein
MSKFDDSNSKVESGKTIKVEGGDLKGLEQQSSSKMLQEVGGEKKAVAGQHHETHAKLPELTIAGLEGKSDKKLSLVKEQEKGAKQTEEKKSWFTKH